MPCKNCKCAESQAKIESLSEQLDQERRARRRAEEELALIKRLLGAEPAPPHVVARLRQVLDACYEPTWLVPAKGSVVGYLAHVLEEGRDQTQRMKACPTCHAAGADGFNICPTCKGTGFCKED